MSSADTDRRHFVEPLSYAGAARDAKIRLMSILNDHKRARVATSDEDFIAAEFKSWIFGFIDDVEFLFDDGEKVIHVKSASRLGISDLGVNRRRVESIRKKMLLRDSPVISKSNHRTRKR